MPNKAFAYCAFHLRFPGHSSECRWKSRFPWASDFDWKRIAARVLKVMACYHPWPGGSYAAPTSFGVFGQPWPGFHCKLYPRGRWVLACWIFGPSCISAHLLYLYLLRYVKRPLGISWKSANRIGNTFAWPFLILYDLLIAGNNSKKWPNKANLVVIDPFSSNIPIRRNSNSAFFRDSFGFCCSNCPESWLKWHFCPYTSARKSYKAF